MSLYETNHLKFQVKNHIFSGDAIYINLGIRAGYCINNTLDLDTQEKVKLNMSCAHIFLNYLKEIVHEDSDLMIHGSVTKNAIHISMKTTKRDIDEDMQELLDIVYRIPMEYEIFQKAVEDTRNDFKRKSREAAYQAKHKLMEFSDLNKGFRYKEFTEAMNTVTFENFLVYMEKLITIQNSFLLINGNIETIENYMFYNFIRYNNGREYNVKKLFESKDLTLLIDQHFLCKSNENYKAGCIRFDFLNKEFSTTNKLVLLSLISSGLFKEKAELSVDEYDSSILYYNQELLKYKDKLNGCWKTEKLQQIKSRILVRYAELLNKKPELYNQIFVEMAMIGSSLEEVLDSIEKIDVKSAQELYNLGEIKITESHLVYIEDEEEKRKHNKMSPADFNNLDLCIRSY